MILNLDLKLWNPKNSEILFLNFLENSQMSKFSYISMNVKKKFVESAAQTNWLFSWA